MVDSSNLYGGVMEKISASLRDFEIANELSWDLTVNASNDSPIDFMLKIDSE